MYSNECDFLVYTTLLMDLIFLQLNVIFFFF